MIPWLNKKLISLVIETGNEFMFLTHKKFDSSYEIRSSVMEEFKIKVPERQTPGIN